jgi:hypothetical protein
MGMPPRPQVDGSTENGEKEKTIEQDTVGAMTNSTGPVNASGELHTDKRKPDAATTKGTHKDESEPSKDQMDDSGEVLVEGDEDAVIY